MSLGPAKILENVAIEHGFVFCFSTFSRRWGRENTLCAASAIAQRGAKH